MKLNKIFHKNIWIISITIYILLDQKNNYSEIEPFRKNSRSHVYCIIHAKGSKNYGEKKLNRREVPRDSKWRIEQTSCPKN